MSKLFQAIRGMNDILPGESALWQGPVSYTHLTLPTSDLV